MNKSIQIVFALLIVVFYLYYKVIKFQKLAYESEYQLVNLQKLYTLDSLFWGKKLEMRNLKDYKGNVWKHQGIYSYYIILFISGGCSSCFESEIGIWNKLFLNLQNSKQVKAEVLAVNMGLNDEKMLYYLKSNQIIFPVLKDDGTYKELFKDFHGWEVIAFLVDENLRIMKVHLSERSDVGRTIDFTNKIKKFLIDQ